MSPAIIWLLECDGWLWPTEWGQQDGEMPRPRSLTLSTAYIIAWRRHRALQTWLASRRHPGARDTTLPSQRGIGPEVHSYSIHQLSRVQATVAPLPLSALKSPMMSTNLSVLHRML
jgi:hypothetical protein